MTPGVNPCSSLMGITSLKQDHLDRRRDLRVNGRALYLSRVVHHVRLSKYKATW